MGVTLKGERINTVFANANETAKQQGKALNEDPSLTAIKSGIQALRVEDVPKTYLAVLAVMLTARALREADELDVMAIQASTSARGYSAASIGSRVASFAKEQGIDLRAKSGQPMNNQPFTFEPRITEDMRVQAKATLAFKMFYEVGELVNAMSSATAKRALALLFHLSRRSDEAGVVMAIRNDGKRALDEVKTAVAAFTDEHSENGRVGQAFVAAVLDLIYGSAQVHQGAAQDPDRSRPGDVHVSTSQAVWLYCEVKQRVIATGDVKGFIASVENAGGSRIAYFALRNAGYSGNISPEAVAKASKTGTVDIRIYQSSTEVLDQYLHLAPGTHATVAGSLLERYRARLVEANCASTTVSAFDALAHEHAELG